ncbi:MAG: ArgE/DapE family deacylase [Pseudomonadota bacterium]
MESREKALLEAVAALEPRMLEFAGRLVAQPSTLGQEAGALAVMEGELTSLGWPTERVAVDPVALGAHPGFGPLERDQAGRYNVVATRPADAPGGRAALFNGHLDVVSPEPLEQWTKDPFAPRVEDGWLHGRGAGDMKGGVAAMTYALAAVERAGLGLKASVSVEGVIEEECTGNGALACLLAGHDAPAVLIPEPFGPSILTHQVGVLWFKVSVGGVPSHVLNTGGGVNAIEKCFTLIQALRGLEAEMNQRPLPGYDPLAHPLNLNIGIIAGGDWPSTVPARAEFNGRLGYAPGQTFAQVRAQVEQALARAAQADPWLAANPPSLEFYGFRSDGFALERAAEPVLGLLNDCHRQLSGQDAPSYSATCTTDCRAFNLYGAGTATCYGPVAQNIHAGDERVNIASMVQVAKVYALFLARWCGLAE